MPRLIAFLRAINVGGHVVTMEKLRGIFETLGFSGVETFIASGNVIFSSRANPETLVPKIEHRLHQALGYEVRTFLRTGAEVAAVAGYKPFEDRQLQSAKALNVGFLHQPLGAAGVTAVMALKPGIDDFHVHGREIYWLCRTKQSESKVSNAVFERALRVPVTFRGLNTIHRLVARYDLSPAGN